MKAVQQEMDAGHRAYTTLRCFQRLFDLIEKPSECDIVQCGWQAYCKRLQGAAKAASLLFDGKRTEALGLARIREQREARTTYEFESFHGKFTRSPAAAVEEALRGLKPWVESFVKNVKLRDRPAGCMRTVQEVMSALRERADFPLWTRFMRPMVERSAEDLAEGIAIYVEAITCLARRGVDIPTSRTGAAWTATTDAAAKLWDSREAIRGALGSAGTGLFSLVTQGASSAVSTARSGIDRVTSSIRESRNIDRFEAILTRFGISDEDWEDEDDLCDVARAKGALPALRAEGYCTNLRGGDAPDLVARVVGCARKIRTQDRRSTPMDLEPLRDLFDALEEGFRGGEPEATIKAAAEPALRRMHGMVSAKMREVPRPPPKAIPAPRWS